MADLIFVRAHTVSFCIAVHWISPSISIEAPRRKRVGNLERLARGLRCCNARWNIFEENEGRLEDLDHMTKVPMTQASPKVSRETVPD